MGKGVGINDALLLFDHYGEDSRSLHTSFKLAGYDCPAAVIEDDGFLPEDVMSVYGFFLGDFKRAFGGHGRPRYFNEIAVPDYWEISGNNSGGKVQDLSRERGRIFYAEPKHRRLVRIVDWYDERGTVRFSDHYNRYGAVYARTVFNAKGHRVNRTYFSAEGKEVIVENYVTGDIILEDEGKVRVFRSKTELVLYFFVRAELKQSRIFFNSLSTPFFVSNRLRSFAKRDVLFWQEPVGEEIPGNMQVILKGGAGRTDHVVVQKRQSYEKLLFLGADPKKVRRLGFIYPFAKENRHRPEALICTNSDQIEHLSELVRALPGMHFHIAALTEMSGRLSEAGNYENVSLYPGVKPGLLDDLFLRCDFYFDINHGSEIVSAVRRAFLHRHLIFAFRETMHQGAYVAEEQVYPADNWKQMARSAGSALEQEGVMEKLLLLQMEAAMAEEEKDYRDLEKI